MYTQSSLLDGRYRVIKHLGSGGMATVLLCEDERLGRKVAVKRLHADSPVDVERRFRREAKLGASLNHPNVVSVFDTTTDAEGVLIVMEYVEGHTLSRLLRHGPLRPEEVCRIVRDVGDALDHAHAQGVVHRDVKPGNVLIRHDGVTKLADLGIATAADDTRITHSGVVLGTAAYMAPEQLDGRGAGPASDIYALAAIAFEALGGRKPRAGKTPMEIAHSMTTEDPPDLREVWPRAPAAAAEVLKRGMALEPKDRPSSAGELARELQEALTDASEISQTSRRFVRRGAAAAGAVGAPTGAGAAATAGSGRRTEPPARGARNRRAETLGPRRGDAPAPRGGVSRTPPSVRATRGDRRRPSTAAWALALVFIALAAAGIIGGVMSGGGDESPSSSADRSEEATPAKPEKAKKDQKATNQNEDNAPAQSAPAAPAPAESQPSAPAPQGEGQQVSTDPATGAALNDQGFRLMNQARYDEAIPILQRAVDSFPAGTTDLNYAYALYNLGRSLRLAGRPDEAIPILEERLKIPNQTETVRQELELATQQAEAQ